jgi:hypothetical protein
MNQLVATFRERGKIAQAAKLEFYRAFAGGVRDKDPDQYRRLLDAYKSATRSALPPGWPRILDEIQNRNPAAVETAIAFLVADPYFNNSGYAKKEIIRRLKRAPLAAQQRQQLAEVVIARIYGPDRKELGHYGRLAAALRLPGLDAQVLDLTQSPDRDIARRAAWIMKRIESRGRLDIP